jgi:peptidoglycan hydrolase FlgJ
LAINPPSDIVLGVATAADPQKVRVAVERLKKMSAGGKVDFQTLVAQSGAAAIATTAPAHASKVPAHPLAAAAPQQDNGKHAAFGKLEAFVLQTFVQAMLPKDATSFFGKGTAGAFWKSMLAEKLANELAKSGQIGLAKRLAGHVGADPHAATSALATGLFKHGLGAGLSPSVSAALTALQPSRKPTLQPSRKPTGAPMTGSLSNVVGANPIPDDRS